MTKREHRPLGYDATRDRRQAAGRGCVIGTIPLLIGLAVCAGLSLVWGLSNLPSDQGATATPSLIVEGEITPEIDFDFTVTLAPTSTLDAWSMTGTALVYQTPSATPTASATLDYCWWQTPSPTPTATFPFTPDSWGATGTAIYSATNPYQTPTSPPARELCDNVPTWTPTHTINPNATPSLTPLPLLLDAEVTREVSPTIELPIITPPATWTPPPTAEIIIREVVVTVPPPEPVIATAPPQIVTSAPIIIQQPPQVVVITATLAPTNTLLPTNTFAPTATPSATPTNTPTATSTSTPTPTPTDAAPTTEESPS